MLIQFALPLGLIYEIFSSLLWRKEVTQIYVRSGFFTLVLYNGWYLSDRNSRQTTCYKNNETRFIVYRQTCWIWYETWYSRCMFLRQTPGSAILLSALTNCFIFCFSNPVPSDGESVLTQGRRSLHLHPSATPPVMKQRRDTDIRRGKVSSLVCCNKTR